MSEPGPEDIDFPNNWDQLKDAQAKAEPQAGPEKEPDREKSTPPLIILLAAAWGDLVAILVVCTAGLLALAALGHRVSLPCLPWAAALAVAWWCTSSVVLLIVRRGTPGMLMAGVVFTEPVALRRGALVLAAALVLGLTLGLPTVLGARFSPLRAAAGSSLRLLG